MGRLPRISTDRLSLRPFTIMDIDRLHALWTQPDMRRFLWDDVIISRDRAADEVERSPKCRPAWHRILGDRVSERKRSTRFLRFSVDRPRTKIELVYGLERAYWGKGLATEASRAALVWLWNSTGYSCVYARTDPPNEKSIAVMQRLGMRSDSASPTLISYVLDRISEKETVNLAEAGRKVPAERCRREPNDELPERK